MLTKKYDSQGNFYYVDSEGNEFRNKPNPKVKVERWITGDEPPPLDPNIKRMYQKIPPSVLDKPRDLNTVNKLLLKNVAYPKRKKESMIESLSFDDKLYYGTVLNDLEMEQYIVDNEVPELDGNLTWGDSHEQY